MRLQTIGYDSAGNLPRSIPLYAEGTVNRVAVVRTFRLADDQYSSKGSKYDLFGAVAQ